ncbi:MAG: winged helix-turn-helix transcriptional regulator [Alphaproteobacteria bacterium]|nr:winged helix-turn-helix transcriptional regulator [Alphaproteobacteria bacterium]
MSSQSDKPGQTRERLERLARLIRGAGNAEGLVPAQWDVLRYLARANRFSNSPRAAAHYLGATKGTISQTIQALQRKGLLRSLGRADDARSVALELTEAGVAMLEKDPLNALAGALDELGDKTAKRFHKAVSSLLEGEIARQDMPVFGVCEGCSLFLRGDQPACAGFALRLEARDIGRLCQKFRPIRDK